MNKKKTLLIVSSLILAIVSASITVFTGDNLSTTYSFNEPYKIVFNSLNNKLFQGTGSTDYSGQSTVKTNNGNDVLFAYNALAGGSSSVWHLVKNNGYFYNADPIHGLDHINLSCTSDEKSFKILWGKDLSFDLGEKNLHSSTTLTTFDFNGDKPTFFKFINTSGSNISIKTMEVSLECTNYYPNLTLSSNYVDRGVVSGGGIKNAGENVTINAEANEGYKFIGWFEGNDLISDSASYIFAIGNNDLHYVAHFEYESYNLTAVSESDEKGKVLDCSGTYNYLTSISIEAAANDGYSFDGWYSNDVLVSSDNPFVFKMPSNDLLYVARFTANSYELTLSSSDSELGSIEGSGSFLYGNNVTISASPNKGVAFLGWFDTNDVLISNKNVYSFVMPHHDVSYIAKFEKTIYTVNLMVNDSTMGYVSGNGSYTFGQNVTISATPNPHFSFFGWFADEILVSQESSYSFSMPDTSIIFEARFVRNYNLVAYSDDEDKGTVVAPIEWGAGLEVTIKSVPKDGYSLGYWCDENYDELSYENDYSFLMPEHNVEIIAVFAIPDVNLELDSNFPDGAVTVSGGGMYVSNKNVSIKAEAIDELVFDGWYDSNFNLVSNLNQYSFSILENTKLVAYYHYKDFNFIFDEFDDSKKTCCLSSYSGRKMPNTLFTPKLFEKYSVTSIGDYSFSYCSSLTSVIIPDSITSIGLGAFTHCSSLTSINIPDGVVSIDAYAFDGCSSLTSITIPNNVASIGKWAFQNCYRLIEVINKSLLEIKAGQTSFGYVAYYAKQVISNIIDSKLHTDTNGFITYLDGYEVYLVGYVGNNATITIPAEVTLINNYAFFECSSLTSIIIPNTVTLIGDHSFYGCSSLESITIPNSITKIDTYAFTNCSSLESITIPNSVTVIGRRAFLACTSLVSIFCEATSKPQGWNDYWNPDNYPVVWGYKE